MNAGSLFTLAWRVVPRLPGPVVRAVFDLVGKQHQPARIEKPHLGIGTGRKGRAARRIGDAVAALHVGDAGADSLDDAHAFAEPKAAEGR